MTLTIDLPSELEQSVRQQAARRGQDVRGFVLQAVREKVEATPDAKRGKRGFSADEVIALLKMPQPAPDDAECQRIVEDELLRKHGA